MLLPPRRAILSNFILLTVLVSALVFVPTPSTPEAASTSPFTAPFRSNVPVRISTWFDHDPLPGRASNWAGTNLLRNPFADGHNGTDYVVNRMPVLAIGPGIVRETIHDAVGALVVAVDHDPIDGHRYQSRYVHLSSFRVTPGQTVERGQLLGISGNTGLSSGPHLHLTLLEDGQAIDPYDRFWSDGTAPCPSEH